MTGRPAGRKTADGVGCPYNFLRGVALRRRPQAASRLGAKYVGVATLPANSCKAGCSPDESLGQARGIRSISPKGIDDKVDLGRLGTLRGVRNPRSVFPLGALMSDAFRSVPAGRSYRPLERAWGSMPCRLLGCFAATTAVAATSQCQAPIAPARGTLRPRRPTYLSPTTATPRASRIGRKVATSRRGSTPRGSRTTCAPTSSCGTSGSVAAGAGRRGGRLFILSSTSRHAGNWSLAETHSTGTNRDAGEGDSPSASHARCNFPPRGWGETGEDPSSWSRDLINRPQLDLRESDERPGRNVL